MLVGNLVPVSWAATPSYIPTFLGTYRAFATYCEQESLIRNGVSLIVNRRVQNAVLGCSLKNDKMICVYFQGKLFNITVIQVYVPTANAKEAEVEWFYDDLQDLLKLIPKKDVLFIIGDWNAKVGSQEYLEKEASLALE